MISAIKKISNRKRRDVDMTEGSIVPLLIKFSIPLMIGNLLQILYNMVDTWVVGNFVGGEAFSAVGTVSPIIYTVISLFFGFSQGAAVVVSQYYGAKKYDDVSKAVHTAMLSSVIIGLITTVLGVSLVPAMLKLINTPAEVMDESTVYLSVYFAGALAMSIFNIGSSVLRSVGDTQRPSYFLAISAVTNVVLDLVFVIVFDMGVFGVAFATVIAQFVSAFLVLWVLFKSNNCVKLELGKLKLDKEKFFSISKIGLPTALQTAIGSFSNIIVQAYINYFGTAVMGGWTAYIKIDQLILVPQQALSVASATFVGQNIGYGNVKRAKRGVNLALGMSALATIILMIPLYIFAPPVVSFFKNDPEIVAYGSLFLRWLTPFYPFVCLNQIYEGALRGSGHTMKAVVLTMSSYVVSRQIYLFVMKNYISNTIIPIAFGYPFAWLVCTVMMLIFYNTIKLEKGRVVK